MPVSGIAIRDCTTSQHGLVEVGEFRTFDNIPEWDVEEYSVLKHFKQTEGPGAPVQPSEDPSNSEILAAIQLLDAADDTHWTASGLPAMAALENILETDRVTRADVTRVAPQYDRAVADDQDKKTGFFNMLKGIFS